MRETNYKFSTALTMVIGIVIGCGIEFKTDDVLRAMNGNVMYGVLGFFVVGIGVLFGALTIAEYAVLDNEQDGIIGYAKSALGDKFAFIVGWFTLSVYYPACIVVLGMVAAIYFQVLIGIDSNLFLMIATAIFIISTFSINILSPKLGGRIQVSITAVKVVPLLIIGIIGSIFYLNSSPVTMESSVQTAALSTKPLSALIAIAFAYDGWIAATNIGRELHDRRVLSRALALGTTLVMVVYIIYFYGVSQIVNPVDIIAIGDPYTQVAATRVVGEVGGRLITFFIVLSIYGGLNGFTLAYLRQPKNFTRSETIKPIFGDVEDSSNNRGIIICISFVVFYFIFQQLINFGLLFTNLESEFDLSVLPIIINYIFYTILFLLVNKIVRDKPTKTRLYFALLSVISAVIGVIVIYGALQVNGFEYMIYSLIILLLGIPFYHNHSSH